MEEPKKENKLFNVFLLGDIKSDKNKLIQQYILNNNKNNTDAEGSNEEKQKTENTSEITQSIEIHGETIKMKILEDPQAEQVFSPNADNSTKPQGIILFYNVTDRDSFDKLKQIISNIMDMNNEMPIVIVGNTSDKSERTVPFEEAKNFADNYGLKYHETTLENNYINMKDVFNDLGEQVLYQDILEKNNANDKSNGKEELTNENEKEESNNEKEELTNEKEKEESNNEKEELTNEKEELSNEKEKEENNEKEQSNEKEHSNENNKRKNKGIRSKSKDIRGKKTSLQRKREKEVREKRLKREQEMQLWYKKREREGIELKKKKALEDKIKLKEKIKEDKILRKQREKEVKEEFLNEKKEKYEKSKKEKEEGEKKNMLEKEKNKMILEKKRKNEKKTLKKLLEENEQNDREYLKQKRAKLRSPQSNRNKQRHNFGSGLDISNHLNSTISDFNIHEEKNLNESQILKRHQTLSDFYKKKDNSTSKKKINNIKSAKSKSTMKIKKSQKKQEVDDSEDKLKEEKEKKEEMERKEKEDKLLQEQMKLRNELKEKYLKNNCNIYRCLYCYEIPIIKINEFNHQIEIYCNCSKYNNHIFSYKYFEEKSLDHPIDNNICCGYCKKNMNELNNENLYLSFCNICNDIICSKDESTHKNDKHSHYIELKDKYKNFQTIKSAKTKGKGSGNKNKSFTPSKNQGTLKKSAQTPKKEKDKDKDKDKKQKEETKSSKSSKKNMSLSGAKSNKKTKDDIDKKKTDESNNTIENTEENKSKVNEEKISIYLNDSCCFEHGKVYNSYCHDCYKNICPVCEEKEHKEHNIQNLNKIILEDDKLLLNLKQSLEKDINDLKDVNNYFNELIEKIKEQFLYFYSLKQKEIEIKQKIIKDYEVIKYNYNCIQNLYNINYKNDNTNKNSIKSNLEKLNNNNNNKDLLSKLKIIFDYLDESIEPTNLPNYYNNYNKILISNGENEITDVIKLDTNDLAVSFFNGCVNIYDSICNYLFS